MCSVGIPVNFNRDLASNRMEDGERLSLAAAPFPRTGKRGVPQQFPRRLFEMLEGETKLDGIDHGSLIGWSNSGLAFRIGNVSEFADLVLPKYFRTKKFSSFQRNLNLVSVAQ
jgi:hypothetical protein